MIQQSTGPGWATGRAWIIKEALNDYFGEIDEDWGRTAKKKALDEIQMGIGNDPPDMFDKLREQYMRAGVTVLCYKLMMMKCVWT